MIDSLHVENIALIENLTLNFYKGLNILSGETGAGKSILIDSLNFVLGERADKSLIRFGADYALVEAVFCDYQNEKVLKYLEDIDVEADDVLILKRKMSTSDKNECRINGKTVTLGMLKGLTSLLCDIHGQHEHQSLLNVKSHIELLDSFGAKELTSLKEKVKADYAEFSKLRSRLSKFGDGDERFRRIDILKYQIEEIEKADVKEGEEDELLEKRKKIRNIEKLQTAYVEALNLLDGNVSTVANLKNAQNYLLSISSFEGEIAPICDRLDSAVIELKDIVSSVEDLKDKLDFDAKEADMVDERLDLIRMIFRKYGGNYCELVKFHEKAKKEFDELSNADELVAQLKIEYDLAVKSLSANLDELTAQRKGIAKDFENKIVTELSDLGMKGTTFVVEFKPVADRLSFATANGADDIEFLISPNKGEPLKPLQKIISGGEMSRFMLALKNIVSKIDMIQTMVFDEIDTGISGHIAEVVAQKLCNISREKQVLAVTHLPQLASMADSHFKIEKYVKDEKTYTSLTKLDDSTSELARLIGGAEYSDFATLHAKEMKTWANNYKKGLKI